MANQHFRNQPNQGNRNSHHPHGGGGFKQGVNRGGYPPRGQQGAHSAPITPLTHIPSPYNFVPLSKTVVFPDWAEAVSHDIPFADGISGHLEIEIEAMTQLYIRNGGDHPEGKGEALAKAKRADSNYNSPFKLPSGRYAIPGTSLKGAIRNVLEIATFSKLKTDKKRFGYRDLQNQKLYTSKLTNNVPDPQNPQKQLWEASAKSGFLKIDDGGPETKWRLFPCQYSRVSHNDLFEAFQWVLPKPKQRSESVTAAEKYKEWTLSQPNYSFESIRFTAGPKTKHNGKFFFSSAMDLGKGKQEGFLVFTGQPNEKKSKEFIFHSKQEKQIDVTHLAGDFKHVHYENGEPIESLAFWHQRFKDGSEIPVFYLTDTQHKPTSIGMAQMYRLPYKFDTHQMLEHSSPDQLSTKLDFAETLLGRIHDEGCLKGRVQFEPAIQEGDVRVSEQPVCETLNSPKPTYYPNYIEQPESIPGPNSYKTYMDPDAKLRGWKRYPVPKDGAEELRVPPLLDAEGKVNQKVQTTFKPLGKGAKFRGRIHFHNLRPVELGALLWSISLGDDFDNPLHRHSLGMAKPLGYGSVMIKIVPDHSCLLWPESIPTFKDLDSIRASFTSYMESFVPQWKKDPSVVELLSTTDPKLAWDKQDRRYPRIEPKNEFVDFKGAENRDNPRPGMRLEPHSAGQKPNSRVVTASPQAQNATVSAPRPRQQYFAGFPIPIGTEVECRVRIKENGKYRLSVVTGDQNEHAGKLQNNAPLPPGIKDKQTIRLIVQRNNASNYEFSLPE